MKNQRLSTPVTQPKSPLLVDTGVAKECFRLKAWNALIQRYSVIVSESVVSETQYYEDEILGRVLIDLRPFVSSGKITVEDPSLDELKQFQALFPRDLRYIDKFDAGETELLILLSIRLKCQAQITSADHVVFKTLGRLTAGTTGVSLQELLRVLGINKTVEYKYSKKFREHWTLLGEQSKN